jgi:hypothetical protein
MHGLVSLYRFALRSGNERLAAELAAILRRDPELGDQTDRQLQELPRGPTRCSAGGERAVRRALARLGGRPTIGA